MLEGFDGGLEGGLGGVVEDAGGVDRLEHVGLRRLYVAPERFLKVVDLVRLDVVQVAVDDGIDDRDFLAQLQRVVLRLLEDLD